MIRDAVERLIADLGDLSPEQAVHAAAVRRLAAVMDGTAEDGPPPLYAMPGLNRELRASIVSLTGGVSLGRGVPEDELEAILRGGLGER